MTKKDRYDKKVKLEKIKTEFENVFIGDGCLDGEYSIEIEKNVPPVKKAQSAISYDDPF